MNRLGHYLVIQDIKRNKAVTAALLGLMFLATLLMASGLLVIERLNGTLDEVYQIARPPDYLVMSNDPYDMTAIRQWSQASGLVKAHQVQELLALPGQAISFQLADGSRGNLSDSLIDHYFVTQNEAFDRLLDGNNQPAQVAPGEIGLPMEYVRRYGIQPGDQIRLRLGQSVFLFRVKGGLRDAQMSSSLASSVRFLIDPTDFEKSPE